MKKQYFDFMNTLKGSRYMEYYITYLISPVLSGVKPSSTICLGNDDRELLRFWEESGQELLDAFNLKTYTLRKLNSKAVILIYNENNLLEVLNSEDNKSFLERLDYTELNNIDSALAHLHMRYSMYHCPHEIGIFLGIPLHDVEAFMSCEGRECLCCGYWKVFSNEAKAKELFQMYDLSKEMVMNYSLQGKRVDWIAGTLKRSFTSVNI
jgi:hypothetical protein